jgi:putative hemolysin
MLLFVLAVGFALVCSFVCSLCEATLLSISNPRVEGLAGRGSRAGQILRRFKREPDTPIAAILILNTIANSAGGAVAGVQFHEAFPSAHGAWFVVAFTIGVLLLSEIVPKTIGVLHADLLAVPVTHVVLWLTRAVWPMVFLTRMVSGLLRGAEPPQVAFLEEIRLLATAGRTQGKVGTLTAGIIEAATRLRELRVRDVMVPRSRVAHLTGNRSIEENLAVVRRTGHSRFPFTPDGDLDRVEGVVLTKELLFHLRENQEPDWTELLVPTLVVPDTAALNHTLRSFQKEKRHMAMVVDEHGGIQGIVTLEDVLEEIVGEIEDELDAEATHVLRRPDGSLLCRGIAEVHAVFGQLGLEASATDRRTLSGFLAEQLGTVPQAGQELDYGGFRFTVTKASNRRADRVRLARIPAEGASPLPRVR